jgi:hypothetical protein
MRCTSGTPSNSLRFVGSRYVPKLTASCSVFRTGLELSGCRLPGLSRGETRWPMLSDWFGSVPLSDCTRPRSAVPERSLIRSVRPRSQATTPLRTTSPGTKERDTFPAGYVSAAHFGHPRSSNFPPHPDPSGGRSGGLQRIAPHRAFRTYAPPWPTRSGRRLRLRHQPVSDGRWIRHAGRSLAKSQGRTSSGRFATACGSLVRAGSAMHLSPRLPLPRPVRPCASRSHLAAPAGS